MYSSNHTVVFNRSMIREKSRMLLKGKWNKCALISLIFMILSSGLSGVPQVGWMLNFVLSGPLTLGLTIVFLKIINNENFEIEDIFKGFDNFLNAFLAYLLIVIFVVLWSLLLIIPGIIAGISYSLTFYIIAENPELSPNDARRRSVELMRGHKWEFFLLTLSFLGWAFLCLFTFGIGFFWLFPYMNTSFALFYKQVLRANSNEINQ